MSIMNKPGKLIIDGNVGENWRVFRREFDEYINASGLENAEDERKLTLLLNFAGTDAQEILDNSDLDTEDKKIFDIVLKFFEDRFVVKTNETLLRFTFFSRSQRENESFEEFYNALQKLAEGCEFDNQKNFLLRDQIVIGIQNQKLREEFLKIPQLSLETAVERCRTSEAVREQARKRAAEEKIADAENFTDDTWTASHADARCDFRKKKTPAEFNGGSAFY
ncbi:uncharacterized protein LOC135836249 [Planococcus citri]|uniref:uncharacterized protein LOC135836249 n=1 Tax=Planococcus citri TaxID=170843 RepID=UPI0031F8F1F0